VQPLELATVVQLQLVLERQLLRGMLPHQGPVLLQEEEQPPCALERSRCQGQQQAKAEIQEAQVPPQRMLAIVIVLRVAMLQEQPMQRVEFLVLLVGLELVGLVVQLVLILFLFVLVLPVVEQLELQQFLVVVLVLELFVFVVFKLLLVRVVLQAEAIVQEEVQVLLKGHRLPLFPGSRPSRPLHKVRAGGS
jgi:hypothetical protein